MHKIFALCLALLSCVSAEKIDKKPPESPKPTYPKYHDYCTSTYYDNLSGEIKEIWSNALDRDTYATKTVVDIGADEIADTIIIFDYIGEHNISTILEDYHADGSTDKSERRSYDSSNLLTLTEIQYTNPSARDERWVYNYYGDRCNGTIELYYDDDVSPAEVYEITCETIWATYVTRDTNNDGTADYCYEFDYTEDDRFLLEKYDSGCDQSYEMVVNYNYEGSIGYKKYDIRDDGDYEMQDIFYYDEGGNVIRIEWDLQYGGDIEEVTVSDYSCVQL